MLGFITASATHNKAGEITYKRKSGYTYEIIVTTYTDPNSSQADRCELPVFFGDGQFDTLPRVNGTRDPGGDCLYPGEVLNSRLKKNVYIGSHTYAGNGSYTISMEDPNRVDGIKNIPNSVGIPFHIKSTLIINPLYGSNSSPQLLNPPIDDACLCQLYQHNPGAFDLDGDSLSYKISVCYGKDGKEIPGYSTPAPSPNTGCGNQIFSIDPYTGTLTWDAPGIQGIFNVCILITEWRLVKIPNRAPYRDSIGNVLRDMQVEVGPCRNTPPTFKPMPPICVIAGDTIEETVVAYDIGDEITLTANGGALSINNSPAQVLPATAQGRDTVKMDFVWNTQCSHVQKESYLTQFKALDNGGSGSTSLARFATLDVKVIGPRVENISIQPDKNSMVISWAPNPCGIIKGYDIYRKVDSTKWTPYSCETGIPSYLGYTKIMSLSGHTNSTFIDDNNGAGLFHGLTYCYRVVATYTNGAESISSDEVCSELPFNTPIISGNSITTTDISNGVDTFSFFKPQQIDLNVYKSPYTYKIFHAKPSGTDLIYSSNSFNNWNDIDTQIEISGLNTQDTSVSFKLELYSENDLIGSTHLASSVFLSVKSDDQRLHLSWVETVPWSNYSYIVYRENQGNFAILDTVFTPNYTDTGLTNGQDYNYYVKSIGKYSIAELPDTLLNKSQIITGTPIDTIPPCSPEKPEISSSCELYSNELSWKNPNDSCFYKDAVAYNLYYTPTVSGEYTLLKSFSDINDTTILLEDLVSVAGCYGVTAIDSFNNESPLSKRVCVDNCPIYELPNVFTPGGDGYNDLFTPLYPYRYVKDIEIIIFNRWGQVMFETNDPDIKWDGKRTDTGKQSPDGVYFYICQVNEIRLTGIIPRELKGYITIINESGNSNTTE
ncbi:MAG: gliding motility-associated C-terminal domain-containing protein [Salibacteraceae bacterium]